MFFRHSPRLRRPARSMNTSGTTHLLYVRLELGWMRVVVTWVLPTAQSCGSGSGIEYESVKPTHAYGITSKLKAWVSTVALALESGRFPLPPSTKINELMGETQKPSNLDTL